MSFFWMIIKDLGVRSFAAAQDDIKNSFSKKDNTTEKLENYFQFLIILLNYIYAK